MTIAVPTSGGWTFNATLEEDEFHMLWLVKHYGGTATPHLRLLLSTTFKTGWRIVDTTPDERALLEAHGFASREGAVMLRNFGARIERAGIKALLTGRE